MIAVLAASVALLFAAGIFLVLQKSLFRVILGFSLLAHAANLMVLASAGEPGAPPILSGEGVVTSPTDPLPQALVLTAIVISMAVTLYLLALLAGLARSETETSLQPAPADDEGRADARIQAELEGEESV